MAAYPLTKFISLTVAAGVVATFVSTASATVPAAAAAIVAVPVYVVADTNMVTAVSGTSYAVAKFSATVGHPAKE